MSQGHHGRAFLIWANSAILNGLMFAKPGGTMRYWLPAVLVLLAGAPAHAAPGEQGHPPHSGSPRRSPDFLFGRPDGSIGIRGNWIFSRAGSDWYDFVTKQLTVERSDFNGPEFAFDVGFTVSPRVDIVAGVGCLERLDQL